MIRAKVNHFFFPLLRFSSPEDFKEEKHHPPAGRSVSFLIKRRVIYPLGGLLITLSLLGWPSSGLAFTDQEVQQIQTELRDRPLGDRMASWAEKFVHIPYDEDPLGVYVSRAVIVADDRVDCMYLTFRTAELALSRSPREAVEIALEKRFRTRGILQNGKVTNYEDRFEYGEDMIASGKWGREITSQIGRTLRIRGTRGTPFWEVLPREEGIRGIRNLKSGDLLFFMKSPEKRVVDEGVGHIGVVKVQKGPPNQAVYLIHAGGTKRKGGAVKKVLLTDYLSRMSFVGVKITRLEGL